jgi:electron transfer flavoprotein alpha/beta subunit
LAGVARQLDATTILVDEASRGERFPEVAAIAELLDAAQLTHVVAIAPDGGVIHASRIAGTQLQTCRVRGPAVIGLRIAGPPIEEYPTPTPSASMKRLDLAALGLDPVVLGHRALPPRTDPQQRRTVERVAEHLAVHVAPRRLREDDR